MRRRWFLKLLGASALVPVVGKAALNERTLEAVCEELRNDGVTLNCISHPYPRKGSFVGVDYVAQLRPGVERAFKAHYKDAPPMFSQDGITWTNDDEGMG